MVERRPVFPVIFGKRVLEQDDLGILVQQLLVQLLQLRARQHACLRICAIGLVLCIQLETQIVLAAGAGIGTRRGSVAVELG